MHTLQQNHVALVRGELTDVISTHLRRSVAGDGQALGGELAAVLAAQVLIPVLLSLVSNALYDVLKAKTLSPMAKEDVDEVAASLIGAELKTEHEISAECLAHLRQELEPLGMTEAQIVATYESIQRRLLSR